jgi:DNA polymerase
MIETRPPLARDLAAAFDWWREAGVDLDYTEDATDWLAGDAAIQPPVAHASTQDADQQRSPATFSPPTEKPAPAIERSNLLSESPPGDLTAFREFWMTAPGLDTIGPRGRVPPRGDAGAKLMVLVVDPEEGDREALLSGPQGRLLKRMLAAMEIAETETYVASALPRHTPMADTQAIAASGMDDVLAHHIKIAAPQRVVALGKNILPLLGHELTQDVMSLREINQESSSVPLLVSEGLDSFMSMPRLKARFWRRWIEWVGQPR